MSVVNVRINGTIRHVAVGTTVGQLVDELAEDRRGVAVAVDGEVVPRSSWDTTPLSDGMDVDVLTAAQGG